MEKKKLKLLLTSTHKLYEIIKLITTFFISTLFKQLS